MINHGLTARQVADRLGVELATVYAYASRGALHRVVAEDGRTSRYDPDEVEALARRARPRSARRSATAVDVVIGTTISEIGDGWIRYRGRDLADVAADSTFEEVAALLWDAPELVADPRRSRRVRAAARRASAALPAGAPTSSRLAVAAAAASPLLPAPDDDIAAPGVLLLDALVEALPTVSRHDPSDDSIAARMWVRCSPQRPTAARVRALDRALVLLAEHELATSTLAVRLAASTRAAAAEAVLAGLGTVSGPLHGRAAVLVHRRLLADPSEDALVDPSAGTGHSVHVGGDPRFELLRDAVEPIASPARLERIHADLGALRRRRTPPPNVDLALGALAFAAAAPVGSTEAVFAVARTAGWLAHAHEEADETPLRYRGRTLSRRGVSRPR